MENKLQKLNIFSLPNEILYFIFSYFDDITILRSKCVCKLWKEVLEDKKFYVWNPVLELKTDIKENFLEACRKGNVISVKYLAKLASDKVNILKMKCCAHDLWNQGLIAAAKNKNVEVTKLLCSFSISYGKDEALKVAVQNKNYEVSDFLLNEFKYHPQRLSNIFSIE